MKEGSIKPYVKKFILTFSITFIVCMFLVAGVFIAAVMGWFGGVEDLDIPALTSDASSQIFYVDANGTQQHITTLTSAQNKVWVDADQIPQHMKDAFVAIEDERFYSHSGFDWRRTMKALVAYIGNQFSGKASTFGGSTITQQLVKNLTGDDDRTAARKIREISQAVNLEKQISKDKILELYMNSIYLSQGCTGVQAASDKFFGKPVNELTLAECASIAGITQYPSHYDPLVNPENNIEKQKTVLKKMLELRLITSEEYDEAMAQELVFGKSSQGAGRDESINSYFVDQVIYDLLEELEDMGYSKTLASKVVYSGGLKIVTTIDPAVQNAMENVYENASNFPNGTGSNPIQSAMVVIDPKTGAVKGIVGGIGRKTNNLVLNRATQSLRQPGSTIKPIAVYAPAMENKVITAGSTYVDREKDFNGWVPHNYDRTFTNHPVTVRVALRKSLNTTPVFILEEMGPEVSYNFMTQKLGVTSLVKSETGSDGKVYSDIGLSSLALGGLTHGISPLELTAAYTPFANGGLYAKPYCISTVTNSRGKVLVQNNPQFTNAMSEETAFIMSGMLNEVVTSGTGVGAGLSSGMYTAGKTGTTSNNNDRWFVGYTPHYVAAVWYGYDSPREIYASGNPCIPVWNKIMTEINKDKPVITRLTAPAGITTASYCTHSGLLSTKSCEGRDAFYFSTDNMPPYCKGVHTIEDDEAESSETSTTVIQGNQVPRSSTTEKKTPSKPSPSNDGKHWPVAPQQPAKKLPGM